MGALRGALKRLLSLPGIISILSNLFLETIQLFRKPGWAQISARDHPRWMVLEQGVVPCPP